MLRAVVVSFLVTGPALAQPPVAEPVPPPPTPTAILTEPPAVATPPPAPAIVVDDTGPRARLLGSFDFLVGTFTGVRYQTAPLFDGGRWSAELFGGSAIVILPSAGVGLRRRAYQSGDSSDILCVSPGVGAYVLFWPWGGLDSDKHVGVAGMVSFDVDVHWTHVFSRRFDASMGVKVGAAVAFGHGGVVPFPVPVAGLYFGCGF
jgi:hypothetical protein